MMPYLLGFGSVDQTLLFDVTTELKLIRVVTTLQDHLDHSGM